MKKTKAAGNVFSDIGFQGEEAANLLIRAQLMTVLVRFMEENELKQARAAKLFGVSQPRISDLKRGKIKLFTVDALIEMLSKAGLAVAVKISRHQKKAA